MGHWEALAVDSRLGLESKLEAAAVEKRGKAYQPPEELKELPKGALLSAAGQRKALHWLACLGMGHAQSRPGLCPAAKWSDHGPHKTLGL